MRHSDHQQSQPPDPPPTPRPDPTPSGPSRKNRHPAHRYASDRTRARNDNQSRNALLIGAFGLNLSGLVLDMTNFATYIDSTNSHAPIAPRGRAKQKRADLRLVGLEDITEGKGTPETLAASALPPTAYKCLPTAVCVIIPCATA